MGVERTVQPLFHPPGGIRALVGGVGPPAPFAADALARGHAVRVYNADMRLKPESLVDGAIYLLAVGIVVMVFVSVVKWALGL